MSGTNARELREGLHYEAAFLSEEFANALFAHCVEELPWSKELVKMFGQTFIAPRLSCALADEGCTYRYRGSQTEPIHFTSQLDELRLRLCDRLKVAFNYVLATQYRDGNDYVGWHADDERDLVRGQVIANVSLGEVREFRIKNRDGSFDERVSTHHGSLLRMKGDILLDTKHTLVRTRRVLGPRVVLSFREVHQ